MAPKKIYKKGFLIITALAVLLGLSVFFISYPIENKNVFYESSCAKGSVYETEKLSNISDVQVKPLFWGGGSGDDNNTDDPLPPWLIVVIVICSLVIAAAVIGVILVIRYYKDEPKDTDNRKDKK